MGAWDGREAINLEHIKKPKDALVGCCEVSPHLRWRYIVTIPYWLHSRQRCLVLSDIRTNRRCY